MNKESALYANLSLFTWKAFINHNKDKSPIKPNEPMTFVEACKKSSRVGMLINDGHPVIGFDLDGVSLDNPKVAGLLKRYPTYIEHTPSNKLGHYRIIYYIDSKTMFKSKPKLKLDKGHIEFFNTSNNYITLTGNITEHKQCRDVIAEIPAAVLVDIFPVFKKSSVLQPTTIPLRSTSPPIDPILWTKVVPCDRHHPLVQRYCAKHNHDYQTYWLYGVMALHHTLGPAAGFEFADIWSQKSGDEYNPEELQTRWQSFHEDTDLPISTATYVQYYNECVIKWPAANKAGTPSKDEISNTKAFMDYHDIFILVDALTTTPFLTGPSYVIIPQYYKSQIDAYTYPENKLYRITSEMLWHMREYNYAPKPDTLTKHLDTLLDRIRPAEYVNRFVIWLEEQPPYNPNTEPDYLALLAQDIIQRDKDYQHPTQEFHNLLIRKWMLSLARTFWPHLPKASSEGLLILHGPPGIYKSSVGQRLIPKEFQQNLWVQTEPNLSGKNMQGMPFKDYKSLVCSKLIVDYDEAEKIFSNNSEAAIKSEVTATVDSFRPAYGKHMLSIPRKYSIMASTNERRLQIPHEGDRRYWWLNVSACDTYTLDDWPVDRMWKQIQHILKQEYKTPPWLLTNDESQYLSSYLHRHRLTNNVEEILSDEFEWDKLKIHVQEYIDKDLSFSEFMLTTPQIIERLIFLADIRVKRPILNRALIRLNKQYAPSAIQVKRTWIKEGYHEAGGQQKFYMFPPKRN